MEVSPSPDYRRFRTRGFDFLPLAQDASICAQRRLGAPGRFIFSKSSASKPGLGPLRTLTRGDGQQGLQLLSPYGCLHPPPALSSSHLESNLCVPMWELSFSNAAMFCELVLGFNCLFRKNYFLFEENHLFHFCFFQNAMHFFSSFWFGVS